MPRDAEVRGGEGTSASAWANASPLGLFSTSIVLCIISAARFACGFVFLHSASEIRKRASFADESKEVEADVAKGLRWCACESSMDPLGRSGKRGVMLTTDFCDACYTETELVDYRWRLLRNGRYFPWLLGILSVLLLLLALAPVLRRWSWFHQKLFSLTGVTSLVDLILNIVVMISWSNSEVFKSLCLKGHAFNAKYSTETIFPDSVYQDVCAYSAREHDMEMVVLAIVILDVLAFMTFAYMQTLREQGLLGLISRERRNFIYSLASRALPVRAFDTRHGA